MVAPPCTLESLDGSRWFWMVMDGTALVLDGTGWFWTVPEVSGHVWMVLGLLEAG